VVGILWTFVFNIKRRSLRNLLNFQVIFRWSQTPDPLHWV
jgi:hypothetical protein